MHKVEKGFTLLETILVLALVALMAVSGLAAYQQHVVSFKVEKTALQIQSLLEASTAYYVTNSAWPNSSTTPAALDNYLGTDVLKKCPWSYTGTTCYTLVPPVAPAQYFSVTITIPSTQTNAIQIANMVAARLPNASVSGTTVTAMQSPPAQPLPPPPTNDIIVKGIYPFFGSTVISTLKNSCPAHTTQVVYFISTGYASNGYNRSPKDLRYSSTNFFLIVGGTTNLSATCPSLSTVTTAGYTYFPNRVAQPGASVKGMLCGIDAVQNVFDATGTQALAMEVCEPSSTENNEENNHNVQTAIQKGLALQF